jgi:hypothetical protein
MLIWEEFESRPDDDSDKPSRLDKCSPNEGGIGDDERRPGQSSVCTPRDWLKRYSDL